MKRNPARLRRPRRLAAILAGALVVMLAATPAAYADRGPSGTITDGFNGWESKTWYNLQEGNNARITMLLCNSNPRIEVWRYRGGPGRDQFVVGEIQYCLNTTDDFWFGNLTEGTYYFKIANTRSNLPVFRASYAVYH